MNRAPTARRPSTRRTLERPMIVRGRTSQPSRAKGSRRPDELTVMRADTMAAHTMSATSAGSMYHGGRRAVESSRRPPSNVKYMNGTGMPAISRPALGIAAATTRRAKPMRSRVASTDTGFTTCKLVVGLAPW